MIGFDYERMEQFLVCAIADGIKSGIVQGFAEVKREAESENKATPEELARASMDLARINNLQATIENLIKVNDQWSGVIRQLVALWDGSNGDSEALLAAIGAARKAMKI